MTNKQKASNSMQITTEVDEPVFIEIKDRISDDVIVDSPRIAIEEKNIETFEELIEFINNELSNNIEISKGYDKKIESLKNHMKEWSMSTEAKEQMLKDIERLYFYKSEMYGAIMTLRMIIKAIKEAEDE